MGFQWLRVLVSCSRGRHWMRVSSFDYDEEGLEYVLDDVKKHYKKYLNEKINMETI